MLVVIVGLKGLVLGRRHLRLNHHLLLHHQWEWVQEEEEDILEEVCLASAVVGRSVGGRNGTASISNITNHTRDRVAAAVVGRVTCCKMSAVPVGDMQAVAVVAGFYQVALCQTQREVEGRAMQQMQRVSHQAVAVERRRHHKHQTLRIILNNRRRLALEMVEAG